MNRMKKLIVVTVTLLMSSCADNKAVKVASETNANTPSQEKSAPNTSASNQQGEGITGYWKLVLEAYDDNSNKKLDEEERKKGIKNRYSFRFNADGTCNIVDMFKGRYEIKTENGKKILYVYRNRVVGEEDKDPAPDIYTIISMAGNELVLLENIGDHTFWVFNRA